MYMYMKLYYIMWTLFTVCSLQFPNNSTIASLEGIYIQWGQYEHILMPIFSRENLKNFIYAFILEVFQHFTGDLLMIFFFLMERNRT